jgi:hypothetical protein
LVASHTFLFVGVVGVGLEKVMLYFRGFHWNWYLFNRQTLMQLCEWKGWARGRKADKFLLEVFTRRISRWLGGVLEAVKHLQKINGNFGGRFGDVQDFYSPSRVCFELQNLQLIKSQLSHGEFHPKFCSLHQHHQKFKFHLFLNSHFLGWSLSPNQVTRAIQIYENICTKTLSGLRESLRAIQIELIDDDPHTAKVYFSHILAFS